MDLVQDQTASGRAIELEDRYGAHNYHPLPVVISRGDGVWVYDAEDNAYFDGLSAYSALNFGHCHPRLVEAATRQVVKLTLTSRAFHNDLLGDFCRDLARTCGKERVLPMNTGAEGVETAIKTARKYQSASGLATSTNPSGRNSPPPRSSVASMPSRSLPSIRSPRR